MCPATPSIEPKSRYLAGLPKGEDAERAKRTQTRLARALQARVAPASLVKKTVEVRVCLQQPQESVQVEPRPLFSRATSNGIPYESLPFHSDPVMQREISVIERTVQSPLTDQLFFLSDEAKETPLGLRPSFAQTADDRLSRQQYVPLTPSRQSVHFPSGINFQAFLAKAKPLLQYTAAKT